MHGVIAGGSVPTVDAGAAILERGGNAADAAVAACLATSAGEPTLTSLAGGGVMIYRDAKSGEVTVCDFFSDSPRLGPDEVQGLEFTAIDLDFGPTTQRFHIGAGSAAVPGVIPGLCQVLERWGSMPLGEVIKPACKFLREGVLMGDYQGIAAKLLEPILTYTESARSVFAPHGRMIRKGDVFSIPQLADTLESLASEGWRKYYDEVLCKAMVEQFGPHAGGLLTAEDLSAYEVRFTDPLELSYHTSRVLTMPPPAAGGTMIALMLALLHKVQLGSFDPLSVEHARMLGAAMTVADEARSEGLEALSEKRLAHWRARFDTLRTRDALPLSEAAPAHNNTTHISVIDADGNAAAVTFSYGEGNAYIIGNSGIVMNNLMGEEDIHPHGFGKSPKGVRLPTMMSPSLMMGDNGDITVLGTGGANRIRTAIVQTLSLLLDHGYEPEQAVAAPRMHYENGVLNVEVFDMDDDGAALEALGANKYVRFPDRSMFFGGVHMVCRRADGSLAGAGDPRRGGVCRIV